MFSEEPKSIKSLQKQSINQSLSSIIFEEDDEKESDSVIDYSIKED